jgi:nicotinate-nucleotide adenylyltransferase
LFALAHVVLIARPGFTLPDTQPAGLAKEFAARQTGDPGLLSAPAGRIYQQPVRPQPVSATAIRALVRAGRRPDGLTPAAVIDYMSTHSLYSGKH